MLAYELLAQFTAIFQQGVLVDIEICQIQGKQTASEPYVKKQWFEHIFIAAETNGYAIAWCMAHFGHYSRLLQTVECLGKVARLYCIVNLGIHEFMAKQ